MAKDGDGSNVVNLALEDGTVLTGRGFGAECAVSGEVVFNTGMSGYVESLSDPSYKGQILLFTYPLIGNYGVPPARPKDSIAAPFESDKIQVQGLIVQQYTEAYSHHAARRTLSDWLKNAGIPAISGIDTRSLTKRLRESGTMKGWIYPATMSSNTAREEANAIEMENEVFYQVAPSRPCFYPGGERTLLLIDIGAKDNIVRSLLRRGASVQRVPWHLPLSDYAREADGIIISNGPGDPKNLTGLIQELHLLLKEYRKPVFGICLGSQLLALACGGNTYKLPYGHRGVNQPVYDLISKRCYITSQNHGYAVRDDSLPPDWEPWFININDGTNEGIRSKTGLFSGVQFHPEACPGPTDTSFLFDDFLHLVNTMAHT